MLRVAVPRRRIRAGDIATMARAATSGGADLLLLPFLIGQESEACDGPLAAHIGGCAEEAGIAILFAYDEACSGNTHLALQLVLEDGRATANGRAAHLDQAALDEGWSPGNWLTIARFGELRMGLLAGLDAMVPEVGRALSALGAEVLIGVVANAAGDPAPDMRALAGVRALENGAAVLLLGAGGVCAAANADGWPADSATHGDVELLDVATGARCPPAVRRPELYRQLQKPLVPFAG